jgi:hypothetical protein
VEVTIGVDDDEPVREVSVSGAMAEKLKFKRTVLMSSRRRRPIGELHRFIAKLSINFSI